MIDTQSKKTEVKPAQEPK